MVLNALLLLLVVVTVLTAAFATGARPRLHPSKHSMSAAAQKCHEVAAGSSPKTGNKGLAPGKAHSLAFFPSKQAVLYYTL